MLSRAEKITMKLMHACILGRPCSSHQNWLTNLCHQNKTPQPSHFLLLRHYSFRKNCISFCSTGEGYLLKLGFFQNRRYTTTCPSCPIFASRRRPVIWVSSSTADCHSLTTSHQSAAAATTNCDNCGRLFDVRRRMPQRH